MSSRGRQSQVDVIFNHVTIGAFWSLQDLNENNSVNVVILIQGIRGFFFSFANKQSMDFENIWVIPKMEDILRPALQIWNNPQTKL